MASHFVRATLPLSLPCALPTSQAVLDHASRLPARRRERFLAVRALLAELMLKVYGLTPLPELTTCKYGRPLFANRDLPDFSIAYAGNVIGVLLAEEGGRVGLDMEMVRAHSRQTIEYHQRFISSSERTWINAQPDPLEASTQIWTLRQSVVKLAGEGEREMAAICLQPGAGRLRATRFPDVQVISDVEPSLVWSCALLTNTDRLCLWDREADGSWRALRTLELNKPSIGSHTLRLTSLPQDRPLQA